MALTRATIEAKISWTDTLTAPTGANRTPTINDNLRKTLTILTATYQTLYFQSFSIAASGTQLINLASFTDSYTGAAVVLTKARGLLVGGTQAWTLGPNNAANPLTWFWGGSTQTIAGDADDFSMVTKAVTFTTGSKLLLTNTGGSTGAFDVAIIGGT